MLSSYQCLCLQYGLFSSRIPTKTEGIVTGYFVKGMIKITKKHCQDNIKFITSKMPTGVQVEFLFGRNKQLNMWNLHMAIKKP
jgi:hypothetical protein